MNRLPPFLCRILAKDGRRILSAEEIASRSGLSLTMVFRLSRLHDWDGVKVGVAAKYLEGCGIDMHHTARLNQFIRDADKRKNLLPHVKDERTKRYFTKLAMTQ